ncbi:MAG: energy transducer TonB [Candidatus Saccharicenans sp.]
MKNITGIFKRQEKRVLGNKGSSHKASQTSQHGYSPIGSASTNSKHHTEKEKDLSGAPVAEWGRFPGQAIFRDSFVVTGKNLRLILLALPLSIVIHLTAVALVIGVPLMSPGSMPPIQVYSAFLAPMPSPAPPPAPPRGGGKAGGGKRTPVQKQQVIETGKLLVPIDIPEEIPTEDVAGYGVEGGVPWGVDYGEEKPVFDQTLEKLITATTEEKEQGPLLAGDEIKPPKLLRRVEPTYPPAARDAHIQGVVVLEATTDIYGRVESVRVLRSVPLLDQAAIEAVRQWVYEPMVINGRPRSVTFTVTITFKLQK